MDFHVFVLVSTIAYYILLRRYKSNVQKNDEKLPARNSSLFYLFFVPFILYLCRYFFPQSDSCALKTPSSPSLSADHSSVISSPYPLSSS